MTLTANPSFNGQPATRPNGNRSSPSSARPVPAHPSSYRLTGSSGCCTKTRAARIRPAIRTRGFGFVEILAPCPTGHGKSNELRDASASWEWYKQNTITRLDLAALDPGQRAANQKIVIGTLWQQDTPDYGTRWQDLVERLQAENESNA